MIEKIQCVSQGIALSPEMFDFYTLSIMISSQDIAGITVGAHGVNNLRYTSDTDLIEIPITQFRHLRK